MLHGDTYLSKSLPLKYIESFLAEYSPECKNKWVVLDQGGKLYNNPAIKNLFRKFEYKILLTSPDASYQNGSVEIDHQTILQGMKALIIGTGSYMKFFPCIHACSNNL